jgi:hypothetical protein
MAALTLLCLLLQTAPAQAQRGRRSAPRSAAAPAYRAELHGFAGYAFTWSRRVYNGYTGNYGDLDIKDSWFWALALDINVRPGIQAELLYNRQDSDLTFKRDIGGKETLSKINVEYWHAGVLKGFQQGNIMPFTSFTLGATRYSFHDVSEIAQDDPWDDVWKFSIILGLGAKVYTSGRMGLRLQARLPITFTGGGIGFGCSTGGGCGATVGGSGITQFDLSGGVFLAF